LPYLNLIASYTLINMARKFVDDYNYKIMGSIIVKYIFAESINVIDSSY